jgi:hypothetical protein
MRTPVKIAGRTMSCVVLFLACSSESPDGSQLESRSQDLRAARRAELSDYVLRNHRQAGHRVVKTEVLDDGSIVDWVDRATIPGANDPLPPVPQYPSRPTGVKAATARELSGPAGAVPYYRPSYLPYIEGNDAATSIDDYIRKTSEERSRHGGPNAGNPTAGAQNRLYAPDRRTGTVFGLHSIVNNDFSGIDVPTSPDFSFYELAAYCRNGSGVVSELVGLIMGRNPGVYGAGYRFGAEWFDNTNATWVSGASNQGPWVQLSATKGPGASITGQSVVNGNQFEGNVAVVMWGPPNALFPTNRWYVFLIDEWVGYFETGGTSFTALDTNACVAEWYGEVLDPDHATTDWTAADMGSGSLPNGSTWSANWGLRGYSRLPSFNTAINMGGWTSRTTLTIPGGVDASCYNVTMALDGGLDFNPIVFFGGPGGNGAGCN